MGFVDRLKKELIDTNDEKMGKKSPLETESVWVTTGSPILDWNLKTFGLKKGFVEFSGTSMAGKTSLALIIAGNYMKQYEDAVCIFMLSEERIDDSYAYRLGVDPDRLVKIKGEFLEDLFYTLQGKLEKIENMWNDENLKGKPKIIVIWDSIGATLSKSEIDAFEKNAKNFNDSVEKGTKFETKHAKMAAFAKSARDCAKYVHSQLYSKDIIFICLNHLTDDLNNPMGGKTSTGGTWREYFCWTRLEMQKDKLLTSKHKIDEEQWGQITNVKVVKNDFGGYKRTQLQFCLGYGLTLTEEDIIYAVEKKILKKEGEKKYSFLNGKLTWNSLRSFYNLYRNENPLMKVLHNKIIVSRHNDLKKEKINNSDE